ncbi:MAG: phosphoribosylformylglycinamidine synthase subunit PurL [Planctomycetota bacterium]
MWHLEVRHREAAEDSLVRRVQRDLAWLDLADVTVVETARLYLLDGPLDRDQAARLAEDLLVDGVLQSSRLEARDALDAREDGAVTVARKPGVMDPVEESVLRAARRLEIPLTGLRSGWCYRFRGADAAALARIGEKLLANPVVDEIHPGERALRPGGPTGTYAFERVEVELPADDDALLELSRRQGLSLDLVEMQAIRAHFAELGRHPTDIELETLAQTWSEHCKHKTFSAIIDFDGERIDNLLKSTVFRATRELDRDFCVSVFVDNAGIIRFDDDHNLCIKVETHNHPSAIEPYGGAGTGLGGVIRDILGTGLGGKPVANTDVFCVGHPDAREEDLPAGTIHPARVLRGVVEGVRDYGNRMGIPTVGGAVFFDERYTGNPLVYAGTIGLIPRDRCEKVTKPGDRIVALGGATGRDGIHGATFSSRELHEESESVDGGAVQIGNAITEKRVMDVLLAARDRGLYRNVTDCGAGGFSSAIGEMGETTGARVELSEAPLKYPGLSYREIWLSEAQERMVLAVPPEHLDELLALCASEDVATCVLGEFTGNGMLEIAYRGESVAEVSMEFLHDGLPRPVRRATWSAPAPDPLDDFEPRAADAVLRELLAHPNVASKEWVIRQYDHEVQSTSCVKPLVGVHGDGPSDGAVLAPVLGSTKGFAVGSGLAPHYGDVDPYHMAMAAIDEALRNVVAVGGDPDRTAILDNFSWGNTAKPDRLGALVLASRGCHDAALALRTPFVSGKDSLNNEYATAAGTICIPHTLLVTALSIVDDVTGSVTMDLKEAGNLLYLVGLTRDELGGSLALRLHGRRGDTVPKMDTATARPTLLAVHAAIRAGHLRACHDLSEGGLAVAAAESAFSGGLGAEIDLDRVPGAESLADFPVLFSESLTRFLCEVPRERAAAFESALAGMPCAAIGTVTDGDRLVVRRGDRVLIDAELEELHRLHSGGLGRILEGADRV